VVYVKTSEKSICIVGTGYVGMASAIGFAALGHRVTGYDILPERIAGLQRGVTPYREAGIDAALAAHLASGTIRFHDDLAVAARDAEFIIICVGTPAGADGSSDLSYVRAAVEAVGRVRKSGSVVVLRSTVPAGTTDRLAAETGLDFVYAPEFLREGSAVADFLDPDRIVVGACSNEAAMRYAALLSELERPIVITSYKNAELIKGYSNAFLALKISFANEVANMCDAVDADAHEVLAGVGHDRRIGPAFLRPGIGFGGPCFEKDVKSLYHQAGRHGIGRELLGATLRVNDSQPRRIVDMLQDELGGLDGVHVAIWGLAFKAGTDDVRDSLALRIIDDLHRRGARMTAYDPSVTSLGHDSPCALAPNELAALEGADALLVLTEWPDFLKVHPRAIAGRLRRRVMIDGRNLFDPNTVAESGITYRGVGRKPDGDLRLAAVS
jgi:UDPglucose 6-dehydrogenase